MKSKIFVITILSQDEFKRIVENYCLEYGFFHTEKLAKQFLTDNNFNSCYDVKRFRVFEN